MTKQPMMFGVDLQLARLSELGDPLEKIDALMDWEMFRPLLRERVRKDDYSKGGRPPIDEILMFKILLLQRWNNTSDDVTEYLVNCRLDWQRFLACSWARSRLIRRRYGCLGSVLALTVCAFFLIFSMLDYMIWVWLVARVA